MKVIFILFGAVVRSTALSRKLDVPNAGSVNQEIVRDEADWTMAVQRHYQQSPQHNRLASGRFVEPLFDQDRIQTRSARAAPTPLAKASPDMFAGLKKMVSSTLQKHGPKITKFAHTKLQQSLNTVLGPKQKGKEKSVKKGGKSGKTEGKNGGKGIKEKGLGKQTRDLFGGRPEPAGPGALARLGNHLATHREEYLNTLMALHGMAQQGADFLEPERMLMEYD